MRQMTSSNEVAEIRRRLAARPERVFAAFADATLVGRWLSPAPEIKVTPLKYDFQVGGIYRLAYAVPGTATMIVGGSFRTIERPSRIVFSWVIEPPDEHAGIASEVDVTITAQDGGALLHIRHANWGRIDAIERHRGGWHGALDQLATLLEKEGDAA
jgi:uncharacterized protein YndB with AHSA1/START domain